MPAGVFDTGRVPGMSDRAQPPHVLAQRRVLNTHWPRAPLAFRTHRPGIAVTVRIVWDRDGEQYMRASAVRWSREHVYVEFVDQRLDGNGVWVKPEDVYRAEPDTS